MKPRRPAADALDAAVGWPESAWAWWYDVRDALVRRLAGIEGGREW